MSTESLSVAIFVFLVQLIYSGSFRKIYPEQIHLSLGECSEEIVITWVTFAATENSIVWYGTITRGLTQKKEGYSKTFIDGGETGTIRYIHKVVLQDLKDCQFYLYRCGSSHGLSDTFVFKTSPIGMNWSPRLIVFGDMGWKNAVIFPFILKERNENEIDAIVHVGDIAYNMDSRDGRVGDEFLRMIEPVASSIPYMTTVGNHEQAYNFSHYKNKFSMPGQSEGLFYSFDMGPAHFIAFSTEVYYFTGYGCESIITQYNWLEKDLKKASKRKNRLIRPWIIVFGHRPMYCSSDTEEDCSFKSNIVKCCYMNSSKFDLENLFHKSKVDIIFSGHMHYYERSWPIYKNQVYNGSYHQPYKNPGATVHIITGAAGMKSGTETANYIRKDWFPYFSSDYSYTVLTINNRTHIHLEQISASKGGKIIDSFWLSKDKP